MWKRAAKLVFELGFCKSKPEESWKRPNSNKSFTKPLAIYLNDLVKFTTTTSANLAKNISV